MSAADGAAPRVDVGDEARERRYLPAVQPKRGVRWSPDEDAVLHAHYRRKGAVWCAGVIGRSVHSVRKRTEALRMPRISRPWTEKEIGILRREWGDVGERTLRRMLPHRKNSAIARKARELNLAPPDQGTESLKKSAARNGLNLAQLKVALAEGGVRIIKRVRTASPNKRNQGLYRWHVVFPDDATAAVVAWLARGRERFICEEAADHMGVAPSTMRRAVLTLAERRPVDGVRPMRRWALSLADATEALAVYRAGLAVERAARIAAGGRR